MKLDHALVLGGGLAGLLTAAVLARYCDTVTVVERDRYPDEPVARKGMPQAHHAHLLMEGGAQAIDELVPGTLDALYSAGARRIGLPEDLLACTTHGWQTRFPATHFLVACGRPLLDAVVRQEVLRDKRITVRAGTEAVRLLGSSDRVKGAELRDGDRVEAVAADLVVDTTGRASRTRSWLLALGIPPVRADSVDSGLVYATRLFRAPEGVSTTCPLITIMDEADSTTPARNGVLLPVENGRWIVTVSGTRGAELPTEESGFLDYARGLRHTLIAELIENAEPLGDIRLSRSTANRRLHYDRLPCWPDGLVVVGDALAAFNPIYGHGMSSAAMSAKSLDRILSSTSDMVGFAAMAQRAIAATVRDVWTLATKQDLRYPDVRIQMVEPQTWEAQEASNALARLGLVDSIVSKAIFGVNTLTANASILQRPEIVGAMAKPIPAPPATPPFKSGELGTSRSMTEKSLR